MNVWVWVDTMTMEARYYRGVLEIGFTPDMPVRMFEFVISDYGLPSQYLIVRNEGEAIDLFVEGPIYGSQVERRRLGYKQQLMLQLLREGLRYTVRRLREVNVEAICVPLEHGDKTDGVSIQRGFFFRLYRRIDTIILGLLLADAPNHM